MPGRISINGRAEIEFSGRVSRAAFGLIRMVVIGRTARGVGWRNSNYFGLCTLRGMGIASVSIGVRKLRDVFDEAFEYKFRLVVLMPVQI